MKRGFLNAVAHGVAYTVVSMLGVTAILVVAAVLGAAVRVFMWCAGF